MCMMGYIVTESPKNQSHHDDNFVITGGTKGQDYWVKSKAKFMLVNKDFPDTRFENLC